MRVCTQKAQQDLRYEENIDAFSMNGQQGRISPTLRMDSKDEGEQITNILEHTKVEISLYSFFFKIHLV